MPKELWSLVDQYFEKRLRIPDPATDKIRDACREQSLPEHEVSPCQGVFLEILARTLKPVRILEIGTLGGYSTAHLARALTPGGRLVSIEIDARRADLARQNLTEAGFSGVVEILQGPAEDHLKRLRSEEDRVPFDFVFIDADKKNNRTYFAAALEMTRPGGLIVIDNVVREGAILTDTPENPCVLGVQRLCEMISEEPRVRATALQTVGTKGWDGFILAQVLG